MIRIYVKIVYTCPDGSVTGYQYKSFDVADFTLEEYLKNTHEYMYKSIVGAEVLA